MCSILSSTHSLLHFSLLLTTLIPKVCLTLIDCIFGELFVYSRICNALQEITCQYPSHIRPSANRKGKLGPWGKWLKPGVGAGAGVSA